MPTRKQRRRAVKERRHEYETVWVDGEGNELEEPPEDAAVPEKRDRTNQNCEVYGIWTASKPGGFYRLVRLAPLCFRQMMQQHQLVGA